MAGLGLTDALRSYQQGVAWNQDQQQRQREERRRKALEDADKAATSVIDASKAEWAINGAHGEYKPNDTTMFKAAEARGQALARAGDWQGFMQNEAAVQGQRIRVRANALQRYEQDGDIESLARTVYPTVFDGKEIVASEIVKGGEPGALKGAPSGPTVMRFTVRGADGKEEVKILEPQKIVQMVKTSLIDPQVAAQKEIELNFLRAKTNIETAGKKEVEATKGEQDRKTEGVRTAGRKEVVGLEHANALELAGVNNASGERRANIAASATRYSADKGLEGTKVRAEGAEGGQGLTVAQKWKDLAKDHFGKIAGGLAGASRMGGQDTLDLAASAQRIYDANKGRLTELQALNEAAKVLGIVSPSGGLDSLLTQPAGN